MLDGAVNNRDFRHGNGHVFFLLRLTSEELRLLVEHWTA